MGIFPNDEMLIELLQSCGKQGDDDAISFDLFARSVALLLEENLDKKSTSSLANGAEGDGTGAELEEGQEINKFFSKWC